MIASAAMRENWKISRGIRRIARWLVVCTVAAAAGYGWYVLGWGVRPLPIGPVVLPLGNHIAVYRWKRAAPLPKARVAAGVGVVGDAIYLIGGIDAWGRTLSDVAIYYPKTDRWERGPSLPYPVHHPAVASDGISLYVVGGFQGWRFTPLRRVLRLAREGTSWEELPPLPRARGGAAAVLAHSTLYLVGGATQEGPVGELLAYSVPENRWRVVRADLFPRAYLAAAAIGGKIYIAGGIGKQDIYEGAALEIYDIESGTLSRGMSLPTPRKSAAGVAWDGLFIVAGGESGWHAVPQVEAYLPAKNSWIALPRLPTGRQGMAVVAIGNLLYTFGGGLHAGFSVSSRSEVLQERAAYYTIHPR